MKSITLHIFLSWCFFLFQLIKQVELGYQDAYDVDPFALFSEQVSKLFKISHFLLDTDKDLCKFQCPNKSSLFTYC